MFCAGKTKESVLQRGERTEFPRFRTRTDIFSSKMERRFKLRRHCESEPQSMTSRESEAEEKTMSDEVRNRKNREAATGSLQGSQVVCARNDLPAGCSLQQLFARQGNWQAVPFGSVGTCEVIFNCCFCSLIAQPPISLSPTPHFLVVQSIVASRVPFLFNLFLTM